MKLQKNIATLLAVLSLATAGFMTACSDWTEKEPVDLEIDGPGQQDPTAYAAYLKALREYKQSNHVKVYGVLENAPETSVSEQDFLRSVPDSLDFVTLANSDRLSKFDIADIPVVQQKGTRVLYSFDYAKFQQIASDTKALESELDKAIAAIGKYGFNGAVVKGEPSFGDNAAAQQAAAKLIAAKFAAVAGPASGSKKLLLFEGDATFLADADRTKFDYFVLGTASAGSVNEIEMMLSVATGTWGIPAAQLFLTTQCSGTILSLEQAKVDAMTQIAQIVISEGPLAGLGINNIGSDYYDPNHIYKNVGKVIDLLNASPKK